MRKLHFYKTIGDNPEKNYVNYKKILFYYLYIMILIILKTKNIKNEKYILKSS